jgi:mannose-6-phosphate isomerase-like protein (cupin superfamily)
LEGNPTIIIGDEEQSFAPDTIIDSPKNVPHGIINNSDKPARLLVIKMPKP